MAEDAWEFCLHGRAADAAIEISIAGHDPGFVAARGRIDDRIRHRRAMFQRDVGGLQGEGFVAVGVR